MSNITLTGMVLSAMPMGEYDKRVVILTKECGKISAFAKGARRMNNAMVAAANPFAFGEFEVYEGRNSYTVVKANISNYFRDLAEDYDRVCYGYYFAEVAEYYGQEGLDERERLLLLYQTLRVLEREQFDYKFIRAIYEFRTMKINGEYPSEFEEKGLHPSTVYALSYVLFSSIQKLYSFQLTEEVQTEFIATITAYRKQYIRHKFKSEDFLLS